MAASDDVRPTPRAAELAEQIRYHRERYYATTSPRSPTPSSTRSCASSRRSKPQHPELARADSPLAEVGRAAVGHVRAGAARRARCSRSTTRSTATSSTPGTRASSGLITEPVALRRRAQARRPRDLAALRGRPARARRHPRRRRAPARTSPRTSRTIAAIPHAARRARACRRGSRCAARCSCRSPRSRSSTGARARRASGCSPNPRNAAAGQPAPEGPARHRVARPRVLRVPARRAGRRAARCASHHETLGVAARPRACR